MELLRRIAGRIGADRAVVFAVAARGWQFVSGPVTMVLLSVFFSPELRGYFYTFGSLLALQVFFELSLHIVLINTASHEWAGLKLNPDGSISGDPEALSRLVSLGRAAMVWYVVAAVLFAAIAIPGGLWFLGNQSLPPSEWVAPWICLVLLTAALLVTLPGTAILEGCDQLAVVNHYRVLQAVCGSTGVWISIISGLGLWAAAVSAGVRLFWEFHLLLVRYRRFLQPFLTPPSGTRIQWSQEVRPLQWRLAMQGIFVWFAMYLMTPVVFHYHGDVAASRMGMTWNVLTALQAGAFAWVETRRPKFGQLVARHQFQELDSLFFRFSLTSLLLLTTLIAAFNGLVFVLPEIHWWLSARLADALLPLLPTLILSVGIVLHMIARCQTIYVRAHRREPFLVPGLMTSTAIGLLVWYLGSGYGAIGAASGWALVVAGFQLPMWSFLWYRLRQKWTLKAPADSSDTPVDATQPELPGSASD